MTRRRLEALIWQKFPAAERGDVAEILRAADAYRLRSPWPTHADPEIQGRRDALEAELAARRAT